MSLSRPKTVTLTGIVIPADWNDHQTLIAAALATADEREYRIVPQRKGKELLGFLQHQIEVTGTLGRDDRGRDTLRVTRYIVK